MSFFLQAPVKVSLPGPPLLQCHVDLGFAVLSLGLIGPWSGIRGGNLGTMEGPEEPGGSHQIGGGGMVLLRSLVA